MAAGVHLVTGGAGFIGSNLVRYLLTRGERVRAIDDFSTGYSQNLEDVAGDVEVVEGSILDPAALRRAMDGVHLVFHHAAVPSVPRSLDDPSRSHEANATGTLAVLLASREFRVERVVYASSSSVYGGVQELPVREALPALPVSPYGVAKLTGELYCRAFWVSFGLPTVSLRYFNVFGPRQDLSSEYAAVIPRFATALLEGKRPVVFGDGTQSRDFTYIDNVLDAALLAAHAPEPAFGSTFNIAHGERHSLLELLSLLGRITGTGSVDVEWTDRRAGDIEHSQADISLAHEVLGYRPAVSFEEGLRRTVEWVARRTR